MQEQQKVEKFDHSIYTRQTELKNADAVAWVFSSAESKMTQYPFTFPKISDEEVRIKILYSGLCHSDCLHVRALWGQPGYPVCPGHEIIGKVTKIGAKVTQFKVGDQVGVGPQGNHCENCMACKRGNTNLCEKFEGLYDPFFGGYATHIQCKARQTFQVPQNLPADKASPLLCAGMTVWAPIKRWYDSQPVKEGLKAGVFGIGGLGHLALQILNKLGVHVTAFTSSTKREKELKELGAHDISSSVDLNSLRSKEVLHQYDIIVNTLYVEDKDQYMAIQRLIRKGGVLSQLGLPPARTSQALDVLNLVINQIRIEGSIVASVKETQELLEFASKHQILPIVEEFGFDEFDKAFDLLENGRPKFRAVVNVNEWAKKNGFDN